MISVIICTYNRADSLAKTLKSLSGLAVPKDGIPEVIVVDNNSNDETRAVVTAAHTQENIRIRYLFEGKQGLSHARNAGIAAAEGDILVFTDDDVIVEPDWLWEIEKTFKTCDADCVGGKILPVWPSERPSWLPKRIEGNLALLDFGEEELEINSEEQLLYGANIAFSRSILERVGNFDVSLGRKGKKLYSHEDKEMFIRILNAGAKIVYQPKALVHHVINVGRTRKSYFRKWHFDDGELKGIMLGPYARRNILGIPLYIIREFLCNCGIYLKLRTKAVEDEIFSHEVYVFYLLGIMSGRVKFYFGG